jgi:hypothetical protein
MSNERIVMSFGVTLKPVLLTLFFTSLGFGQVVEQKNSYKAYLAQRTAWNEQHYTKSEVHIPMRDGKKLSTGGQGTRRYRGCACRWLLRP